MYLLHKLSRAAEEEHVAHGDLAGNADVYTSFKTKTNKQKTHKQKKNTKKNKKQIIYVICSKL